MYRIKIYFTDIYYDTVTNTRYSVPDSSSTQEGYYSAAFYLYDENGNGFAYYYIDIRYLWNRDGYFYNDQDGFYRSK